MPPTIRGPLLEQSATCNTILRALPDWFGIEQSICDYVSAVADLPTLIAQDREEHGEEAIGFLSIKQHFPHAAEAYVLGVLPQWHRRGVGRQLFDAAEHWLVEQGVQLLQVKTLAPTAQSEHYERTRRFYESIGFMPVEIFPTLWSPRNPCLLMMKTLRR